MSCSHNPDKLSKYSTVSHISSTGWLNRLMHPSVTLKKTDKSFPAKSSQASSFLLQHTSLFCGQIIQSLSILTIKSFFQTRFGLKCEQISVNLEGADYGAVPSFLVSRDV